MGGLLDFFSNLSDAYYPEDAAAQEDLKLKRAQNARLLGMQDSRNRLLSTTPENTYTGVPQGASLSDQVFGGQGQSYANAMDPAQSDPVTLLGAKKKYDQMRGGLLDQADPDAAMARMQTQMHPPAMSPMKLGADEILGVPKLDSSTGKWSFDQIANAPGKQPPGLLPNGQPDPAYIALKKAEGEASRPPWASDEAAASIAEKKAQAAAANSRASLMTNTGMDDATIEFRAQMAAKGDTDGAYKGIPNSIYGSPARAAISQRAQEISTGLGNDGGDQAATNAEFFGTKAGERTLGTRSANIEMAVNEASNMGQLARQASAAVPRGTWMPVNSVIMAAKEGTGDPSARAFGAALNSYLNAYATAVGKGTMTVDARNHAQQMLSKADGQEAFTAIMDQLDKEILAAKAAPGQVRAGLRAAVTGKTEAPSAAPATGVVKWTRDANGNPVRAQ